MRTSKLMRLLVAAPALLLCSSVALADATIDGEAKVTIKKERKIEIVVPVTMSNKGTVTFQGMAGQTAVNVTKKFKTGAGKTKTKNIKLKFDLKKLGLEGAMTTIFVQGQITAAEEGQAEPAGGFDTSAGLEGPTLFTEPGSLGLPEVWTK